VAGRKKPGQKQTCLLKMSTFSPKNKNKSLATKMEKTGKNGEHFLIM